MKEFVLVNHLEDLDPESNYLVHKAKEATDHAYAPYSKFLVGAAALLDNGKVVTGSNQENAAYPSGMCAERVAVFAVASQFPDQKIIKMAVAARHKGSKELVPATSCGPCRQVMLEFETRQQVQMQIVMQRQDHQWIVAPSAESLLPFCFSKTNLAHHDASHHA